MATDWIKSDQARCETGARADPRRRRSARFAHWHLQFRLDTDVRCSTALLHVIIHDGFDRSGVHCGPRQWISEALKAAVERQRQSAWPICGIDAETIRAVARAYATSKASMILWGMGISQHVWHRQCAVARSRWR